MKDPDTDVDGGVSAFAFAVNPNVPAQTLGELIDYVEANPGKVSYGSAGAGTMNHLCVELFKSLAGIKDLPHVAYRGAGPAIPDAIAGQIPIVVPAMTNQVYEFHRATSCACWRSPTDACRSRRTSRPPSLA